MEKRKRIPPFRSGIARDDLAGLMMTPTITSRTSILVFFPGARRLQFLFCGVMGVAGLSEIILHQYDDHLLRSLMRLSDPLLEFFFRFIPALRDVPDLTRLAGYYDRVEFMRYVLLWNFMLFLGFSIVAVLSIVADLWRDGPQRIVEVEQWVAVKNKPPAIIFFAGVLLFAGGVWVLFTSAAYVRPNLFASDFQLLVIAGYFALVHGMNEMIFALFLASLWKGGPAWRTS